jgi:hypothetical protein
LEKKEPRKQDALNFIEIDAEKADIDLINSDWEMDPNSVLAFYNYLLRKGIIERA